MIDLHKTSAQDMARAQNYLTLATAYCRTLGGLRWSDATVSIGFFQEGRLVGAVPLDSYGGPEPERPLIRVSITAPTSKYLSGWMTRYADVRMECR